MATEEDGTEPEELLEESDEFDSTILPLDKWVLRGVKKKRIDLTRKEEKDLCILAQAGDSKALGRLWIQYEAMAADAVHAFKDRGTPMADLHQEAFLGFHAAVMGFNPLKKCKLGTYAYWYIRSAVRRAYENKGHMVKVTPTEKEKKDKLEIQRVMLLVAFAARFDELLQILFHDTLYLFRLFSSKKRRGKKFDALEALCEGTQNRDGISYAEASKDGKQRTFTVAHVCLDMVGTVGEDQLALHERIACSRPTPDNLIDSAADCAYLYELLESCGMDSLEREFLNVKWGLWDSVVKSNEQMSTLWRWSLDKVKEFDEEVLRKVYSIIDRDKLSADYFDKRNKKRFDS